VALFWRKVTLDEVLGAVRGELAARRTGEALPREVVELSRLLRAEESGFVAGGPPPGPQEMVDGIPDPAGILDPRGRLAVVNPALDALVGTGRALGRTLLEVTRSSELGADDFVTKPFSMRELVLRARAVLRRGVDGESDVPRERVGPLRVDLPAHRAFVGAEEIALTALEFKLLATFMSRVGRLQTRGTLLRDVWGLSGELQTRTVDTHVKRLREKLGAGRDLIETVRGSGYRMVDPEEK